MSKEEVVAYREARLQHLRREAEETHEKQCDGFVY
jgi:hypothetical protein